MKPLKNGPQQILRYGMLNYIWPYVSKVTGLPLFLIVMYTPRPVSTTVSGLHRGILYVRVCHCLFLGEFMPIYCFLWKSIIIIGFILNFYCIISTIAIVGFVVVIFILLNFDPRLYLMSLPSSVIISDVSMSSTLRGF